MALNFTLEELKAFAAGQATDELKGRINDAEKYEASAGLRAKVKTTANSNAEAVVSDSLKSLEIPAGVSEIKMIFDYQPEATVFTPRKSGVTSKFGNDVMKAPAAEFTALIAKAFALKKSPENDNIVNFITKAVGGQAVIDHTLSAHKFAKETEPALTALHSNATGEKLAAGITEVPENDKPSVTLLYSKLAADKPLQWNIAVSCGKTAAAGSGGGGGKRKAKTPAPEGHASWKKYLETDTSPETVAALKWAVDKYGQEWTGSISPTNLLRQRKHPAMLEADAANPARS